MKQKDCKNKKGIFKGDVSLKHTMPTIYLLLKLKFHSSEKWLKNCIDYLKG